MTAVRSGEARGARWAEIEREGPGGPVWTIPAARMKAGKAHRVPLAPPAVALLDELRGLDAELVFPSNARRGRPAPLTAEALARILRRIGAAEATSTHGLRSTFRDWAGETGHPRELAELCLAHRIGNVTEQAYARSYILARRRVLMDAWARHVTGGLVAWGRWGEGAGSGGQRAPTRPLGAARLGRRRSRR